MTDDTTVPEGSTDDGKTVDVVEETSAIVPSLEVAKKAPKKVVRKRIPTAAVSQDIDGDGIIDVNPADLEALLLDLAPLDKTLREHGSSVASLLRFVAKNSLGVEA